ncbi:BMP family ABC transporter substrate-binding protein [Bacillus sp. ISL-47]|uniref:BMP family ABC transporter substrate-binding protein n=1 Tax=Bacillus sp. ISL-47 TaxID=2819130 RepID=UPI001BE5EC56|nr:BMP family ABC transporter substrate-binding protein [Bacillus sp. ISL-47]MBT2689034.1 BMP family ABC transporter substrate-binding protein [Bacillus sp. ISL-47]MBT2708686.1 BMP family ABC transporter substrate-binding protein [Pseudomonas sp. ISL-84]
MHKTIKKFGILLLCLLLLVSCGQAMSTGKLEKAGLLVPDTVNDQVWGTKGYKGMLKIQSQYNVEVFYKEGMNSEMVVERAVKEFDQKGVNLIFGHGNEYVEYFNNISKKYPHIHFVSFNGNAKKDNTTSLNFEAYAMGFFGGMVAGHVTKTETVGVLAAFEWQPEVEGFYEGANHANKNVNVEIQYVGNWDNDQKAIKLLDKLISKDTDVVYPAGDGYNVPVIEKLKEKGLYAIGFISDQSDLGESVVLTSTVQHVDVLYELVAEKFNKGELDSGNLSFDFQDEVISLGKFSPIVDEEFKKELNAAIEEYKKTGKLPNE